MADDNNTYVFKMFAIEDKLDGDNYPMGAYMMTHGSKGVWNIVLGIDSRWDVRDAQAHAVIALSMKHSITPHICSAKSAKQAWVALAGLYASCNVADITLLCKKLESKIMQEEDDMDAFFASIKDIDEQLISAREVISDNSHVQTIIDALRDLYQTFVSTWRFMTQGNPQAIKFDTSCTLLL
ncbi:hypothetical protein L7F22_027555 [Adiantum nelumboides]|nr:hypothetical protein [Adiantum nelumboides]